MTVDPSVKWKLSHSVISTGDLAVFVCNVALVIVARSFTCLEGFSLVVACIEVRSMDTPGQANHGP